MERTAGKGQLFNGECSSAETSQERKAEPDPIFYYVLASKLESS